MAKISAALVKELRQRTGAGMMECKRALEETGGDLEKAIEWMRKQGLAKAAKKAGRVAAEGTIVIATAGNEGVMVEVNSETDFVARNEDFQSFAQKVAEIALHSGVETLESLLNTPFEEGQTVEEACKALIAKLGENLRLRRLIRLKAEGGQLYNYSHGGRIGVLLVLKGGDDRLGKDLAMQVAAARPQWVRFEDVPEAFLAKEREILREEAQKSGKPEHIIEKMVEGRLRKQLNEIVLIGQPFIKDPDTAVGELLKQKNAEVVQFARFEVGEGIEKQTSDLAAEVQVQLKS